MSEQNIYAEPKEVTDINDCYFYHTVDIPGYGTVEGEWDLREKTREYLGGVDFKGKRVLEMGTASGFLGLYMESQGAQVVSYDLSEDQLWDIVPFARNDNDQIVAERKNLIRKLNNGFWLNHKAHKSGIKKVYGTVYAVPEQIGMVDITTFGSILVHVRDPFLALQSALRLTKETVIITQSAPKHHFFLKPLSRAARPYMFFLPRYKTSTATESWWCIPPETVKEFIGILGFEDVEVTYHTQKFVGRKKKLCTIVGHRTGDIRPV